MSDFLNLDPKGMAEKLAYYDVMTQQTHLKAQQKILAAQKSALSTLKTSLTDFRKVINDLNKFDNGMLQNNATQSVEGMANITVDSKAGKGSYSFYVDKLASAHQVSFENLTDSDIANDTGTMSITLDGKQIDIDMNGIDTLSDLASEINSHSDNPGVTSSVVRTGGKTVLMMSSDETGAANKIDISMTGTGFDNAKQTEISSAADAEVWLGEKGKGLLLTNSSNTFDDVIAGVSIEFKQAHKAGDSPLNVIIGTDSTATKEQLNSFIDSYNELLKSLEGLTKRGSPGNDGGAFAGDSAIMSLKSQLNSSIREQFGNHQLTEFGISANRDGQLTLDSKKLDEILKSDPSALTDLFNGDKGMIKSIDKELDSYLSNSNGQLKMRQDTLDRRETQLSERSSLIEVRYDSAYNRYLKQYSSLQKVMAQMNSTMSMFSNVGAS